MSDLANDTNVPINDCISRQAAIDELIAMREHIDAGMSVIGCTAYEMAIEALREPERKKGKWEERKMLSKKIIDEWQSARCSVCGKYHTTPYMYYFDNFNFCPNCGARMEE